MSLVVVGSIGLDTIETPRGKVSDALGGSAIYASLSASYHCQTHLVGVVGEDFPQAGIALLAKHGINLDGLETRPGRTFRWRGKYDNWNQANTLSTELNVFADFSPNLPESCKCCRSLLLANIHPLLQTRVLDQITSYQWVACDTMNYWITLCPDDLTAVMQRVDIVFLNEDEIRQYTGRESIFAAAKDIFALGVKAVVIKRGEYGSVTMFGEDIYFAPAYPVDTITDPTGAGDCFAGGFMSYLACQDFLNRETIRSAVLHGTALAAMNVGSFSVEGIINLDLSEIEVRVQKLRSWT